MTPLLTEHLRGPFQLECPPPPICGEKYTHYWMAPSRNLCGYIHPLLNASCPEFVGLYAPIIIFISWHTERYILDFCFLLTPAPHPISPGEKKWFQPPPPAPFSQYHLVAALSVEDITVAILSVVIRWYSSSLMLLKFSLGYKDHKPKWSTFLPILLT